MTQKSRRFSCRDRHHTTGAVSKNPIVRLEQTNLAGEILAVKDSEAFGSEFPKTPDPNCSIVTFQNTGQIDRFTMQVNSQQIPEEFKESNASVAMYAVPCLHETGEQTEQFHACMVNWNHGSLSKISYNKHANSNTHWNYPGGTALTMDRVSRAHMRTYGADSTGLGRWTWVRLEGRLINLVRMQRV